jgi:hypothetical protein
MIFAEAMRLPILAIKAIAFRWNYYLKIETNAFNLEPIKKFETMMI